MKKYLTLICVAVLNSCSSAAEDDKGKPTMSELQSKEREAKANQGEAPSTEELTKKARKRAKKDAATAAAEERDDLGNNARGDVRGARPTAQAQQQSDPNQGDASQQNAPNPGDAPQGNDPLQDDASQGNPNQQAGTTQQDTSQQRDPNQQTNAPQQGDPNQPADPLQDDVSQQNGSQQDGSAPDENAQAAPQEQGQMDEGAQQQGEVAGSQAGGAMQDEGDTPDDAVFKCTKGNDVRIITVQYEGASGNRVPCRVLYNKQVGGSGEPQVIWHAKHTPFFCDQKAHNFIYAKHESAWSWQCDQTSGAPLKE